MKKKNLLLSTLAGSVLVAGMAMSSVNAESVNAQAKIVSNFPAENENAVVVQLMNGNTKLLKDDVLDIVASKYNVNKEDITIETVNSDGSVPTGAKISLKSGMNLSVVLLGDVNMDGSVNILDAQVISRYSFGGSSLTPLQLASANIIGDKDSGVTILEAQKLSRYSFEVDSYKDSDKQYSDDFDNLEESIPNIFTVSFKDDMNIVTDSVKTDSNGFVVAPPKSNVTKDNVEYRLVGWATKEDAGIKDVIDLETTKFTQDTNLYSVWIKNDPVKLVFHYDNGKEEEVTTEKTGYMAGDCVNFADLKLDTPTYPSTIGNGVTFTFNGWYAGSDKEQSELDSYIIPERDESSEGLYTINLHPAWHVDVVNAGEMTGTIISNVIDEITKLQKENDGNCAEIEINSETKISNLLNVAEGVNVIFDKKVVVDENGSLSGHITRGTNDATITKIVDDTNVNDQLKGLNSALNNELFNKVQLKNSINSCGNIEVKSGSKAELDLNNYDLQFAGSSTFKISGASEEEAAGELKIINTGSDNEIEKTDTITIKNGIENNGKLIIGDDSSEDLVKVTTNSQGKTTIKNGENATLTIDSGIIENKGSDGSSDATAVIENVKGGTVEINGGKIDANTEKRIPALLNKGTITIEDGEIIRSSNKTGAGNGYYVIVNNGTLTINGGTFEQKNQDDLGGNSALIENGYTKGVLGLAGEKSILEIYDGVFKGGRYLIASDYNGDTKVYGGKYEAVGDSADTLNTTDKTRSIFKVVGKLELKLDEANEPEINLGDGDSKTALVLIGDQYLTDYESKTDTMHECEFTIHPFNPEIVKIGDESVEDYDEIGSRIINEKMNNGKDTERSKSNIIAYVGASDPKEAGKQLMEVIKNSIAQKMEGINSEKNKVEIILTTDVEIESSLDTDPEYKTSKENTTLKLNGKTLTIHKLAVFKKNVDVSGEGSIVLKKENSEITIYENGDFKSDVDLAKIADQEVDKEE